MVSGALAPSKPSSPNKAGFDPYDLPDFDRDFISHDELDSFERALSAPEVVSVTALNDWRPVRQKLRKPAPGSRRTQRSKDETREGFGYTILKWPLLLIVFGWLAVLFAAYGLTRIYIYCYEHLFSWTGQREQLRRQLQGTSSYPRWVEAARQLDDDLGNSRWKTISEYAYYDYKTIQKVTARLQELRTQVDEGNIEKDVRTRQACIDELRSLLESCVKNNFAGFENPRLYSETYYGTKDLVQGYVDEVRQSLQSVLKSDQINRMQKRTFFTHLDTNYGRTALCLSGGATFAYYHFGVVKALLDADCLPQIIAGTSGGALIAALAATRTDDELRDLLVPALAHRIHASPDGFPVWFRRWWHTGARFDSLDWARQCSWFCRGSMTFREAYERTGRILNVTCVPSDPHSPTILANYLTSPDCVIWSAVLASAAVPGILNPVVLMRKTRDGRLVPYAFGHKWKDGSLRTDIPLKALNLHFNVNFSIVSQVNPHINLFFFWPRGSPGRPVTHRRGRGWRGGFLGSSIETTIKLDLQKYLKILRHLELLPRPLGQDWSEIWLQRFSGTITLWPKSVFSDFFHILSDPSPTRLARMIRAGERSAWPKIKFIDNRLKVEKLVVQGLRAFDAQENPAPPSYSLEHSSREIPKDKTIWNGVPHNGEQEINAKPSARSERRYSPSLRRQSSLVEEVRRQSAVFFDDVDSDEAVEEEALTAPNEGHYGTVIG